MHFCPYRSLLLQQAQLIRATLTKRLIRRCQAEERGIGSDGLRNLWEEICLAIRSGHPMSEMCQDHMLSHLTSLVKELPPLQQQTLWVAMNDDPEDERAYPSNKPASWPVDEKTIARFVLAEDVLYECANYDNARIRAHEGR